MSVPASLRCCCRTNQAEFRGQGTGRLEGGREIAASKDDVGGGGERRDDGDDDDEDDEQNNAGEMDGSVY